MVRAVDDIDAFGKFHLPLNRRRVSRWRHLPLRPTSQRRIVRPILRTSTRTLDHRC